MAQGDNWIGDVVSAIAGGPNWSSTAIFITYDDCGCFYDHVPPPVSGWGIRLPMVIVSPYAKAGYTDHSNASLVSMTAYAEHTFGLAPMTTADTNAYWYQNSFDYSQTPLPPPTRKATTRIPRAEERWISKHAPDDDVT